MFQKCCRQGEKSQASLLQQLGFCPAGGKLYLLANAFVHFSGPVSQQRASGAGMGHEGLGSVFMMFS